MHEDAPEILLVEDDPDDVELTLHAFEKHGMTRRIHVSRDGQDALEFLFCRGAYADRPTGQQPKLILLDLKLPKVDGLEVLREIRANTAFRSIPVVVLTSSREIADLVESYSGGGNSYALKPLDFEAFIETMRRVEPALGRADDQRGS
jgi:two-component system response regulator